MSDQHEQDEAPPPGEWAIVEVMGHKVVAGLCREMERFGTVFLGVEWPGEFVRLYSPAAVFSYSPCTEEQAREVARWRMQVPSLRLPAGGPPTIDAMIDVEEEDDVDWL